MARTFAEAVAGLIAAAGWQRLRDGDDLLAAWASFVNEVANGYDLDIYEYENDRSVRDMIERVLANEGLRDYPELADFARRVGEVDERFRSLMQDGVTVGEPETPWWARAVPRNAGPELSADFIEHYGIAVPSGQRGE
jgi:hypothetical protein